MKTLLTSLAVLALASSAHADDIGYYGDFRASLMSPEMDSVDAATNDRLSGTQFRTAFGIRLGRWGLEPNLALVSVDHEDYAMNTSATLRDYASYGLDVRYTFSRGPASAYLRGGVHRAWSQARASFTSAGGIDSEPGRSGGGIGGALGLQFVTRIPGSPLSTAFYLEAGRDLTWIHTASDPYERISSGRVAMGFYAGTNL